MIATAIKGIFNHQIFENIKKKNRSKIIIYPNLNGFSVGILVFFCFLISVFYENNFALLLSIIIFFIFFISIFISNQNLNHLNIQWKDEYFLEQNKYEKIYLQILNETNEKKLNIDLDYQDKTIGNFNFLERFNKIFIPLLNEKRGTFKIQRLRLKSTYPFGIIRTKRFFDSKSKLIVFPKMLKPNQDLLNEFNINFNGHTLDEFDGIEDYKNGDDFSKIAWKKSTLKNKKYIKKFEQLEREKKSVLNLDLYQSIEFETLLSYATFIVQYYYKNKINLTVKHLDQTFYLNQNENSLNQILKYLANVQN
jgi:hypothetical protein